MDGPPASCQFNTRHGPPQINTPSTFRGYFDLKDYLEALLGRTVDLVTERGLKPRARRQVERDLISL